MKRLKRKAQASQPEGVSLGGFIFYLVTTIAVLAGLITYSVGANLETALLRTIIVLLIGLVVGHACNIAIVMAVLFKLQPRMIRGTHGLGENRAYINDGNIEGSRVKRQGYLGLGPGRQTGQEVHVTSAVSAGSINGMSTVPIDRAAAPTRHSEGVLEATPLSGALMSPSYPPEVIGDGFSPEEGSSDSSEASDENGGE